ncbi:acyltransferase-like protein At1g54570, chloroplastic, partial [Neltuma alba]|uniref:acyltransferase-like protein At1g54570, chloroplastic n=1 Tax=Neltuma alba TaxID=207710 RepID=UPI0010A3E8D7
MAPLAASVFPGGCPPCLRYEATSSAGRFKSNRIPLANWRLAVSVEEATRSTATGILEKRGEEEGMRVERAVVEEGSEWWEQANEERKGWKAYLEESEEMIRPDGGPPRWFSPLDVGSRFNNSPLLLFLPELVKMVERTVRSENQRSPKRPIYLVGDSVGACLALAVAARNPDIDLVLILANPATSFDRSQLQLLTPLLETMPGQISPGLPYFLGLMA